MTKKSKVIYKEEIPYQEIGMLAPLTRAYLSNQSEVSHLFHFSPELESVSRVIESRKSKLQLSRNTLVSELRKQYGDLKLSKQVSKNLNNLENENCFTITTGHQLNLFSGPVFFVYKIVAAIKTANELNELHPDKTFVPVYWMASEDHDFEEINHTFIRGKKYTWNSEQTGMVGDFEMDGIESVIQELEANLPSELDVKEYLTELREAYVGAENLATAMRTLVNKWFGKFGLVIVDGNSSALKAGAIPVFKDELLNQNSFKQVNSTIASLPKGFKAQVNPREINLFYVAPGIRERIVSENGLFEVLNTSLKFTEEEILSELNENPERFSPNVILRPVYQEIILPNVMYIGGGAEVAYWLLLKSTFDYHNVSYPLNVLRNAFGFMGPKTKGKLDELGLQLKDVFLSEKDLIPMILGEELDFISNWNDLSSQMLNQIDEAYQNGEVQGGSLERSLASMKKGVENQFERFQRQLKKRVKQDNKEKLNRVEVLKSELFPNGVFQERRVNVLDMKCTYGSDFVDQVYDLSGSCRKTLTIICQ